MNEKLSVVLHIISLIQTPAIKEPWLPWPLLVNASTEPRAEFCHSRYSVSVD